MKRPNYETWSMGELYANGRSYHTLNPPRKEKREHPIPAPKDEILYRDIFILRPVYRRTSESIRFLGYVLVMRTGGAYWKCPQTLVQVKAHADAVNEAIRAAESIAHALSAIGAVDAAQAWIDEHPEIAAANAAMAASVHA